MRDYASRLIDVKNQIRHLGENLEVHKVIKKIIVFVCQGFEANISAIEESHDLATLSITKLTHKLHVPNSYQDPPLYNAKPYLAQRRVYNEDKLKQVSTYLLSGLVDYVFTKFMDLSTPKQIWDFQNEYEGNKKVKSYFPLY